MIQFLIKFVTQSVIYLIPFTLLTPLPLYSKNTDLPFLNSIQQKFITEESAQNLNRILTQNAHATSLPLFIVLLGQRDPKEPPDHYSLETLKRRLTQDYATLALENSSFLLLDFEKKRVEFDENIKITSLRDSEDSSSESTSNLLDLKAALEKNILSSSSQDELRSLLIDFVKSFFELTESPLLLNEEVQWTLSPALPSHSDSETKKDKNESLLSSQEPAQFHNYKTWSVYFSIFFGISFFAFIITLRSPTFIYFSEHKSHTFQILNLLLTVLFSKKTFQHTQTKGNSYEKISTSSHPQ